MKNLLSVIKYMFTNYLPIFSRWRWKYVVCIINISLLAQIIGSHFWWYLCSIFSFQPTKYSLLATDRLRNPPTLLRIIRMSLFFFQQCSTTTPTILRTILEIAILLPKRRYVPIILSESVIKDESAFSHLSVCLPCKVVAFNRLCPQRFLEIRDVTSF